jgi:hypothetical protein
MPFRGRNYQLSFPPEQAKLRICYKNFQAFKGISHIGLGVSALNCAKVLRSVGIDTDVWAHASDSELAEHLASEMKGEKASPASTGPPTHLVISAPWVSTATLTQFVRQYPNLSVGVNCHSNVGFLQADANGVKLLREYMQLETASWNFRLSGNTQRFSKWVKDAYNANCAYLPNMYWLDGPVPAKRAWTGGVLRIGGFGAMRPLKNFMSAAAAALEIASTSRADLEFWCNSGRNEAGGEVVFRAMTEMFRDVPFAQLKTVNWQTWPAFRETVRHMHLLIQPSYSESFSMVVADAVSAGVPSVISEAIEWCPDHWAADSDDVFSIARTGRYLIHDPNAVTDGWNALEQNNQRGIEAWKSYLTGK